MGLFGKKKLELVAPVYTDMRIAEEQLPPEIDSTIRKNGALFLQPEKLSQWAISTLYMDNNPDFAVVPQDSDPTSYKGIKAFSQILIPLELMEALLGNGDPLGLVLEFENWERTKLKVLDFESGGDKAGFLGYIMEEMGLEEKEFRALVVPDYTGRSGAPGEHFHFYVLLHPQPHNGLDYVVLGQCPPLAQPVLGGVDLALRDAGEIFNRGKAIPGLVKVINDGENTRTRFYLPREVVEATGWWADEVEGIPSSLPNKK